MADTVRVVDEKGPGQQDEWNELRFARFEYTATSTVIDVKLARLSKQRTRVFANVQYADNGFTRIKTAFREGRPVARGTYTAADGTSSTVPVAITYLLNNERVRLIVDNTTHDPRPDETRALFGAFTVQKGALHGPLCPFKPGTNKIAPCNDDYVTRELFRD